LKYKIKIGDNFPKLSAQELNQYKRVYLGISLKNSVFWEEGFEQILAWAADNFDSCLIVVADYLHRHNERILHGASQEQSIKSALELGKKYVEQLLPKLTNFPAKKFKIVHWQELLAQDAYQKSATLLNEFYLQNTKFKDSIDKSATHFVKRQQEQGIKFAVSEAQAIDLSIKYLLEEMAVFDILVAQNWQVEIYPGTQLPVLKEIAKGDFENISKNLQKRIFIGLSAAKYV
jgi:tRNA-dependent cyclodipeptide synthase